MKILVAVDGSKNSMDAVDCLINHADWFREKPQVELVTVHLPVPKIGGMGAAVSKSQIRKYYDDEGQARLTSAKKRLGAAGVPFEARVLVGPIAESIVDHAKAERCDIIYIGTRGMTALGKALIGSTAAKVLHISTTPVLLVK
ncbi:MAG: universal stress protein [Betaproteobacteria bacterium]|nr:MAG: universal stress protein [Betaproteobacteria bacterium]